MRYIITNPSNGAPVGINGVMLEPGMQMEVTHPVAHDLKTRYEFLALGTEDGDERMGKKPAKAGALHWKPASDISSADVGITAVEHGSPEPAVAPPSSPSKPKAKKAKK